MRQQFYESVCAYLEQVTEKNFHTMYEGLVDVVQEYNDYLCKEELLTTIGEIFSDDKLDDWQVEVLGEINARIIGECAPVNRLNLK